MPGSPLQTAMTPVTEEYTNNFSAVIVLLCMADYDTVTDRQKCSPQMKDLCPQSVHYVCLHSKIICYSDLLHQATVTVSVTF